MTLTLILTRHAKSTWDDPTLDDHDRPLNARGFRAATRLGQWMAQAGWAPGEAQVSTALRTRQTADGIGAALATPPRCQFHERLYHAGPERMLSLLHEATDPTVLMIGHNPGIAAMASQLVAETPRHDRFHDYPTGATTVIRFDKAQWADVDWGDGTALDFVIPRELD